MPGSSNRPMRIFLRLLRLILTALLIFAAPPAARAQSAPPLTVGESYAKTYAPLGSMAYSHQFSGTFTQAGSISFVLHLDGGQAFSFLMTPDPSLLLQFAIKRGKNLPVLLAPAQSASQPGQALLFQSIPLSAEDDYWMEISTLPGSGLGNFYLTASSAALEAESALQTPNDTLAAAQSIDSAFTRLGGKVQRAALIGNLAFGGDQDFYLLRLEKDETLQVVCSSSSDQPPPTLQLLDASGGVLKEATAAGENARSQFTFPVPQSAYYALRIASSQKIFYILGMARGGALFEQEPNDTPTLAQPFATSGAIFGQVGVLPTDGSDQSSTGIVTPFSLGFNPITGAFYDGDPLYPHGIRWQTTEFLPAPRPLMAFSLCLPTDAPGHCTLHQSAVPTDSPVSVQHYQMSVVNGDTLYWSTGAGNGLSFRRIVTLRPGMDAFTVTTQVQNHTGADLPSLRALETLNPDPNGVPNTYDDVLPDGKSVMGWNDAGTLLIGSPFAAAASADGADLQDPARVINHPVDPNGANFADVALQLAFDLGALPKDAQTSYTYLIAAGSTPSAAQTAYSSANPSARQFAPDDWFSVPLLAGQKLELSTLVPFAKNGLSYRNALDPALAVYAPDLTLVAANDDRSASDPLAQINYIAPTNGSYFIRLSTSPKNFNSQGGEYVLSFNVDTPPTLDPIADQIALLQANFSLTLNAADVDLAHGDGLQYSLLVAPPGMTINPNFGVIAWKPAQVGVYPVTAQVSDSHGLTVQRAFQVEVKANATRFQAYLPAVVRP